VTKRSVGTRLEPLFLRLDRIAGGRKAGYTIPEEMREHPSTRRAFVAISWLLAVEVLLGIGAVVVAVVLATRGERVPWAVWMRSGVVLAMTVTLFYFSWRAERGYYWAYSRLRLFSKIFPVVTLVIAAIPGLYPLWMVTEQIVFSLILIGVSDYLSSDHMRTAFPKPS
jgi:membrane-associated HD superfamily phosphohydrolase